MVAAMQINSFVRRGKLTNYKGITFHSRLEAQWAYFLDQQEIGWLYEPSRMRLPECGDYVPDFYIHQLKCWLEVKGPVNADTIAKPMRLWRLLKGSGVKVVIGTGEGRVMVPELKSDGTVSMDGFIVNCSNCEGLWMANPNSKDSCMCIHCGEKKGGEPSLLASKNLHECGVPTRWIGAHDPLAYRAVISDVIANGSLK